MALFAAGGRSGDPIPITVLTLTNVLRNVIDWETLGTKLGVRKSKIKEIAMDRNYRRPNLCKCDVLDFWLRNDHDASWGKLAAALDNMDECNVASNIRGKYL